MILPENGSVVIIDDQPQEAIPLIQALSKHGISATYYKGYNKEDLPTKNLQSVRLVILDLQLFSGVNDSRTIATNLVKILQQVIGENNGPYILLLWSKKESIYSPDFVEEVKKPENKVVPLIVLPLPKNQCLELQSSDTDGLVDDLVGEIEENFSEEADVEEIKKKIASILKSNHESSYTAKPDAIETIEKAIDKELKKAGVFHLFVIWENLLKKSGSRIVADVFSLVELNEEWELNARDIIRRMGEARVGINEVENNALIKEAINTLNNSFIDNLELEIKKTTIPEYIEVKANPHMIAISRNNTMFRLVKEADGDYAIYKAESRFHKDPAKDKLQKGIQSNAKIDAADKSHSAEVISIYDKIPNTLNTKLHIELSPSQELMPGNIYVVNPVKKKQYLGTYFKKPESLDPDKFFLIELEVSPICDYALSKWSRSRVVSGIIYPNEFADQRKGLNTAYFYDVEPIFEIEGSLYRMRFDFRLFDAVDKTHHKETVVKYRLKREILLDIIAQLSSHVHRPGISFVS